MVQGKLNSRHSTDHKSHYFGTPVKKAKKVLEQIIKFYNENENKKMFYLTP